MENTPTNRTEHIFKLCNAQIPENLTDVTSTIKT